MPSRLPWRKLLPGLAALLAVVAVAFAILEFAGVGSIHGKTIRVYVVTDQANGVMRGTEVWLAGQKIGRVTDVAFLSPTTDTTAHVVLTLEIRASDAAPVRRDARPVLRAGANVLGPMVVYVDPGTPDTPAIAEGDTLHSSPQSDVQVAMAKLSDATQELGPLMSDARAILADVRGTRGSVGALLHGGLPLPALRARYTRVTTRDGTGEAQDDLLFRVHLALARVDSVRTLVAGPTSFLGRFRRDSSLSSSVAEVRSQLGDLSRELQSVNGTVGRLQADAALLDAVAAAQRQMTELLGDIRRRPARYINF
jgi:phospholipid/cholesterol/gamma-HCH transport system substrate-binding protein